MKSSYLQTYSFTVINEVASNFGTIKTCGV